MDESKYNVSDEEMASLVDGLDNMLDEDEPVFFTELKEACWNILHENPGIKFGDWQNMLLSQYPSEVVDALGSDPKCVFHQLSEWWSSMDYEDPATGMCHSFQVWSEYFATDRSVELYDMLVEAKRANHFITNTNTK